MEVRIRHLCAEKAITLDDVPFLELGKVIPFIQSWGLHDADYVDDSSLFGQFKVTDTEAFFEVVYE